MFGIRKLKEEIGQLEKTCVRLEDQFQERTNQLVTNFGDLKRKIDRDVHAFLQKNTEYLNELQKTMPPYHSPDWTHEGWRAWKPQQTEEPPEIICVGETVETRIDKSEFKLPEFYPFIGHDKHLCIQSDEASYDLGLSLMQALVVRASTMLGVQARFALLDPAGSGGSFPMARYLPLLRPSSSDLYRDLDDIQVEMRHIIQTYLDASVTRLDQVEKRKRMDQPFELIFVANFPKSYDRRSIEALQSISRSGIKAGKYLFIHHNRETPLPHGIKFEDFENLHYLDLNSKDRGSACNLVFYPNAAPPPEIQNQILKKVKEQKVEEHHFGWEEIEPEQDTWWEHKADTHLTAPIGDIGGRENLEIWFGRRDSKACAHGIIAAMTGAGKSNLYHVLILGMAMRYSPDELHMYLIDGKDGVEFEGYDSLPHVEVLSLQSSPDLSRSVLAELLEVKGYRNRIFSQCGVQDFTGYREAGQPRGKLPRILLLVDEYQELFEDEQIDLASNQLLQLAQQGRSAGIHMLLGSQRFGVPGMLNQGSIFGNIHLRIAMQMTDADRNALTEFGPEGRRRIVSCDRPGKVVVNQQSGSDGENQAGKIAFIDKKVRMSIIEKLCLKAGKEIAPEEQVTTIIFKGKNQPGLLENPMMKRVLKRTTWLSDVEWENFARKPIQEGGLDEPEWFRAEKPMLAWLGQEFSVRRQAKIIFRRRGGEHLVVLGNHNPARYGMLASVLVSLAANVSPTEIEFAVLDNSVPHTPWSDVLKNALELTLSSAGFTTHYHDDEEGTLKYLDRLHGILKERTATRSKKAENPKTILLILTEPDRVEGLLKVHDRYGPEDSEIGKKLAAIYSGGARNGIHVVMSCSGVMGLTKVIDKKQLEHFAHRIALQMSEDESFTFLRSRKASILQREGPIPVNAFYMDLATNRETRFKPYSTDPLSSFTQGLRVVGEKIHARSNKT